MEALIQYWKNKYEPTELVEHLNISMDDLLFCISDWIDENMDDFKEDIEIIFGYAEEEDNNEES